MVQVLVFVLRPLYPQGKHLPIHIIRQYEEGPVSTACLYAPANGKIFALAESRAQVFNRVAVHRAGCAVLLDLVL